MSLDIKLHPKQLSALISPANEILYGGAVGGGKALALDTPIITTKGWKTIGTIKVGDKVFDEQGLPCNVIAKSEIVEDNTYRVTFDRGISIVCDGRHQWHTVTRNERHVRGNLERRKGGVRTTTKIAETIHADNERANHCIQTTKPLQFKKRKQSVDSYFFGMWLIGGFFYDKKKDIMKQCISSIKSDFSLKRFEGGIYQDPKKMAELMVTTGADNKNPHIPDEFLYCSEKQRRALLAGMVDVAGTVDFKGKVNFSLQNKEFGKQFQFLINSLGIKCRLLAWDFPTAAAPWRVQFRADRVMFTSQYKKGKLDRAYPESRPVYRQFYIKKVEKIDDVPKQCIQVDSPSHLFLAGEEMIPTHNSYLMRVASIVWAMECPGLQIYLFRLTRKELDDNHMVGSGGYYELLGEAVTQKHVKINKSDYKIEFKNGPGNSYMGGSIIHLCHCQYEKDKYNYRGAEFGVLMIDEATLFTRSKYEYLRTRVRIPKAWKPPEAFTKEWGEKFFPRILLGTNPGGIGHNYFRRDFVKIAPPMTIVQMPKDKGGMLRQFIPAVLSDNPSIDKEEYEGKVLAVGNEATARMLLDGDWDAIAGGMFDDVWDPTIHMIEPFDIPASWYVDRAFDWGSAVPFSVGWYAESDGTEITTKLGEIITYPAGTIFRIAEWYGWTGEEDQGLGLTGYEIGSGIKQVEIDNPVFKNITRVRPGPADNQIWNNNPKMDSAYASIAHEMNAGWYGKESYKHFDIFTRSDKTQGSNVRGWANVRTYLKNSLKYPMIDRKSVFFFNTCVHVPRILPTIERDESNIEEIAKNQEDHIMDEIKYRLSHEKQIVGKIKTRLG